MSGQAPDPGLRTRSALSVRRVIRWLYASVAEAVLSGFAFLLLTGRYINEGRVVLSVSQRHGLHSGDLFVLAGWFVATCALVALVLSRRRPTSVGTTVDVGTRHRE
jgi:hypothetical protein